LHAGSVLAALSSYLDARARQGQWLLRIEDLDPPRESPTAVSAILHTLEALGLDWDGPVLYQSKRHAAYDMALASLRERQLIYACDCSRKRIAGNAGIYNGYCRDRQLPWRANYALRCRVTAQSVGFTDRLQGWYAQQLEREVGDFVLRRRDGLHAYQLAVVVDDAWQGITDVVRGMDLLDSTPRQIWLQQLLQLPTPRYAHVPLIIDARGQKLSKQQHAAPVDSHQPGAVLVQTLQRLGLQPDQALAREPPATVLAWALPRWNPENLNGIKQIPEIVDSANPAV